MGHMLEMMQGSDVSARVETGAIEFLPRVLEFANMGLLPAGVYRNRNFAEPFVDEGDLPLKVRDALFGPADIRRAADRGRSQRRGRAGAGLARERAQRAAHRHRDRKIRQIDPSGLISNTRKKPAESSGGLL